MNPLFAMGNIFIDPASAVKQMTGRWAWVWPVLLTGAVMGTVSWLLIPDVLWALRMSMGEKIERSIGMVEMMQRIAAAANPLLIAMGLCVSAGLLMAACSMLDIKSSFREMYTLAAYSGLIPALQALCGLIVIRIRGEHAESMRELMPAFGMDLIIHDTGAALHAVLNYFSLFNLWYILILALAFSYLTKVSKGAAFAATMPVWVTGLLFRVVASLFQK